MTTLPKKKGSSLKVSKYKIGDMVYISRPQWAENPNRLDRGIIKTIVKKKSENYYGIWSIVDNICMGYYYAHEITR